MRKYGAFAVKRDVYNLHDTPVDPAQLAGAEIDPATHLVRQQGQVIGVEIDGKAVTGFTTPSRKLELFSQTLHDWHWPSTPCPAISRATCIVIISTMPKANTSCCRPSDYRP